MSTETTLTQTEKRRLEVLWQYEVLDTVPEMVFDDFTQLAANICEAPIALISLVDEDRQWFKSRFGVTLTQTPRDVSFCAHAIKQTGLFIVPDATKDARFADNPLVVSEPRIRFYAGAPLVAPDGHALGTLCIIDMVPRELRDDQKQALTILARHVVTQLELRRRSKQLKSAEKETKGYKEELERTCKELDRVKKKLADSGQALPRRGRGPKRRPSLAGRARSAGAGAGRRRR